MESHKHHYKLKWVVWPPEGSVTAKRYIFKCEFCYDDVMTTSFDIWHPSKVWPISEYNIDVIYERFEMLYTKEDLKQILRESAARGATSNFITLRCGQDGVWRQAPVTTEQDRLDWEERMYA